MPNNSKVLFTILALVSGLASCGGSSVSQNQATGVSPPSTTAVSVVVSASATPIIITSGSSAVVTWSSVYSTSCSASNGLGGTGTSGSFTTPNLSSNTTYTITCVGPTGTTSQTVMVAVANTPTLTAILNASNAWANTPVRTGPVYYYCDCGTGADSHCVAGNNANTGTNSSAPRQTIKNAATLLASFNSGTRNTIALCKGGAFNAQSSFISNDASCALGSTCTDLREYTSPVFASSAKPIINAPPGSINLFSIYGSVGGLRILNLELRGDLASIALDTHAVFVYNGAHDITIGNVTINSFQIGLYEDGGSANIHQNKNLVSTGNFIANNMGLGFLGAGPNAQISYNYFDGNGSSNTRDHSVYISGEGMDGNVLHMNFVGNYMHGQYGPTCYGGVLVVHGTLDYLTMANNVIDIEPSASDFGGGCAGMSTGDGLYPTAAYFGHVAFSGNTIRNAGNISIGVAECVNCLVNDNVITYDMYLGPIAIVIGQKPARTSPPDSKNTGTTVINNTIWLAPNTNGGVTGIQVINEGTGYIVANNTVNYTSTNAGPWGGVNCFNYSLPLSSFAFINNNHCNSAAPYKWEATNGATLSAWKVYATSNGFDSASIQGGAPTFVNSVSNPYDFHPSTILLGKGSTTYAPTTATDITGTFWSNPPAIGAYE